MLLLYDIPQCLLSKVQRSQNQMVFIFFMVDEHIDVLLFLQKPH